MALSVRAPVGSLLVGVAPRFAWGAAPGVPDVLNMREGTEFRGDLLVHQSRTPDGAELRMKFRPEDHGAFPQGALLGVVRVKEVSGPSEKLNSPWALEGFFHWHVCYPRPFREPLWRPGNVGLYEVHSFEVQRAVEEAEYTAQRAWRALPAADKEMLVERAAIMEEGGLPPGTASRESIAEFRASRARRGMLDAGNIGAERYGKHRRAVDR